MLIPFSSAAMRALKPFLFPVGVISCRADMSRKGGTLSTKIDAGKTTAEEAAGNICRSNRVFGTHRRYINCCPAEIERRSKP